MRINTVISDGVAREDQGPNSLEVCVVLGDGSAEEIEDDIVIPLIVVDGKAGMLSLDWLIYHSQAVIWMAFTVTYVRSSQMLQI